MNSPTPQQSSLTPTAPINPMTTIIIDNLGDNLCRISNGNMNSGLVRYTTTTGLNPFGSPTDLSFMERATSIKGSIITDCIMAAKERVESGILYVYAIGHLGRLYKIQVNDPTTHNPDFNTPVLLATLSSQSPTFTMGGSIEFYAGYIFIGSDMGVTKIDYAGTNETFIGSTGTWAQNVPRPLRLFIGNLYCGNANNIAEITTGFTVTTYTKLSPAFPTDYQTRDIDVTADGVYLVMTTVRNLLTSILSTAPDTTQIGSIDSVAAYWNGTDSGATSFLTQPTFNQSAYHTFGTQEFLFGNDAISASLNTPQNKIVTLQNQQYPLPNSISSIGNMVLWMAPEYNGTKLIGALHIYGQFDNETDSRHIRLLSQNATLANADVLKVPCMLTASNFSYGGAHSSYASNQIGIGKVYFSTIEYDGTDTSYNFYSFNLFPTGTGTSLAGVFETLQELFGKKVVCKEIRFYLEPASSGMQFQSDLIGIDGNILSDSSALNVFTAGTTGTLVTGETLAWYNPNHQPSPAIGLRISNQGTVTPIFHKIELDVTPQGK